MTTKADEKMENQVPTSCGTQDIRTDVTAPSTADISLLQTASALSTRHKLGPVGLCCTRLHTSKLEHPKVASAWVAARAIHLEEEEEGP